MAPSSYVGSIKSLRTEILIGSDSKAMNSRTTTDVVIILGVFLALIVSFSVLAWRHPTSLGSLRVFPIHDAALPITEPVTIHGHNFAYLMHIRCTLLVIYHWWTRASHNRINHIPSITVSHHEHTVARASFVRIPPVCITRSSTCTPATTAVTSSSDASAINSEATELRELDECLSISSVPETDDVDIVRVQRVVTTEEPIVYVVHAEASVDFTWLHVQAQTRLDVGLESMVSWVEAQASTSRIVRKRNFLATFY